MPKAMTPQKNRQAKTRTINGQFSGWCTASRVTPTATCNISTDKSVRLSSDSFAPLLCAADDPELAAKLRVEERELGAGGLN